MTEGTKLNQLPAATVFGSDDFLAGIKNQSTAPDGNRWARGVIQAWLDTIYAPKPGGRLTLTSGVPVTTADVTGATSVYYTPYVHPMIPLWDGTKWVTTIFTEKTLALGTVTSGLPYDVFGYLNSGELVLEKAAWASATARVTAVSLQDGRYCKTGDKTRLYLGTFYTTSTTQTEDSEGGTTTQVGGKRFLWNAYNRVRRSIAVIDTTDSWSYTTDTIRQAGGAAGNKVELVIGLAEDAITADIVANCLVKSNASKYAKVGVGLDATNAFVGVRGLAGQVAASFSVVPIAARYQAVPAVGYHYLSWNEKGADSNCSFAGDYGADGSQSGLYATVWA